MTRTNIDIDDELIESVMRDYHLRTKREAVDFALRRARRAAPLSVDEALALRGSNIIDPTYDLDSARASRNLDEPSAGTRSA